MYASNEDWVFSSIKLHGKQPRTATTMVADYIRPRAVELKIIEPDCTRFGFHNFRHSLATFLLMEGQDPDVVRQMLRQKCRYDTALRSHG